MKGSSPVEVVLLRMGHLLELELSLLNVHFLSCCHDDDGDDAAAAAVASVLGKIKVSVRN